ncbi:MAG: hypothetical protein K8J08_17685 [Thermoanaerobaculia bacterium]|nr:hypothetical protein [Thermoanaerobaculia bacterium]
MPRNTPALLALAMLGLVALSCGEGTPIAPSSAVLTISANPTEIGLDGISVLSISAVRSTGVPVNPGTEIVLTTTLGSVPTIVTTDDRGLALAHLAGGRQSGSATITAASGGATAVTTTVEIGDNPTSLNLTANPTRFSFSGGRVRLSLAVLGADGQPLPGVSVLFSSTAGRLDSGGSLKHTNADGQAADTLRLSSTEAAALAGTSIQVTARVTSGGGEITSQVSLPVDALPTP